MLQLFGVVAVFLLTSLLVLSWQPASAPGSFRGLIRVDLHGNTFWECSQAEPWGLSGETRSVTEAYETLVGDRVSMDGDPKDWIYVEVEGHLSESGRYGPWGMYDRELRISETKRVQPNFQTTCHDKHDFSKPARPKYDSVVHDPVMQR